VLPKLDHAIFADTGWEPKAVYGHLDWLEGQAAAAGIPVHRVSAGNIRTDLMHPAARTRGRVRDGERNTSMPFFSRAADGSVALLKRQCTKDYKIEPIERRTREILGLRYRSPWPKSPVVELWMGISVEEQRRARVSDARWKTHRFPLMFDLPKAFRRHDCLLWLQEQGYPMPPRSACIGCPFHSQEEWRAIRADPEAWESAVEFDAAIRRKGGHRGDLFLHRQAVPLPMVDLSSSAERGQAELGFREECLGYCGN
jgi:hypothetical protein